MNPLAIGTYRIANLIMKSELGEYKKGLISSSDMRNEI